MGALPPVPAPVPVPVSAHATKLPASHALLALAVVVVWGTNFPIIKVALGQMPPVLLAVLRYAFALLPAAFFIRRPAVPWPKLAVYGVLVGVGQFGLLYIAIDGRISPGLASLVIQNQVFFTIALAMLVDRERLRGFQWVALGLAAGGIVVIALNTGGDTTAAGLGLVLVGAASWGAANTVARSMGRVDVLGVVVWSSAFALPPLIVLSLLVDGPERIVHGLGHASLGVWAAVLWQAVGNTLFGYAVWAWLLARYPAATVSPLALLVPVFGMATSALTLGEPLPAWKLGAAALVLGGLALNLWWPRKH